MERYEFLIGSYFESNYNMDSFRLGHILKVQMYLQHGELLESFELGHILKVSTCTTWRVVLKEFSIGSYFESLSLYCDLYLCIYSNH